MIEDDCRRRRRRRPPVIQDRYVFGVCQSKACLPACTASFRFGWIDHARLASPRVSPPHSHDESIEVEKVGLNPRNREY